MAHKVGLKMALMLAIGTLMVKILNKLENSFSFKQPFRQPFKQQQSGFTLIEIMVVVVVAAIMAAFLGVRIDRDDDRIARLEAKRFITVLNEVRDEALMTGRVYALQFKQFDRSYAFYSNPSDWQLVVGDRLLRERALPEGIEMEFDIEEIENDEKQEELISGDSEEPESNKIASLSDYILISPVDELTPFSLTLSGEDYRYQISLNDEQKLETKRL